MIYFGKYMIDLFAGTLASITAVSILNVMHNAITLHKRTVGAKQQCQPSQRSVPSASPGLPACRVSQGVEYLIWHSGRVATPVLCHLARL